MYYLVARKGKLFKFVFSLHAEKLRGNYRQKRQTKGSNKKGRGKKIELRTSILTFKVKQKQKIFDENMK